MFKINNEKELLTFLKILTEESVKKSKKILKEEDDPYVSYYKSKRKQEEEMFNEQEEAAADQPPEASAPPEPPPSESMPEEEAEDEDQQAQPESESESFVGSKDRLVDFVNDIRSAPSIKDSAVSEQIDAYYDRLSQEEKDVLVFFLRELSRVMTGKASGEEARDPSDPPLNIDFVSKEREAPKEDTDAEQAVADEAEPTDEPDIKDSAEEDEGEDTSPPIKVNESQDHRTLRKKIKNLLR